MYNSTRDVPADGDWPLHILIEHFLFHLVCSCQFII
jgi:hypothetical protein